MYWIDNVFLYEDSISMIVCLNWSASLFIGGFIGVIYNNHNILKLLICFELMFFAIILQFIFFSIIMSSVLGQVYALCLITIVGSESAIACSLLILVFRLKQQVSLIALSTLKG